MNFIWVWNVHLSGLNRFYFSLKGFYKGKPVKILILFSVESLITALIISECVIYYNGEGNGTPLQRSCLENPMDGGAWWAAVHGAAKSQTWLSDFLSLFTFLHWRRKWQPTPVFLPGESQGRGSLVGCRLWGRTELDTTEATQQQWCKVIPWS